MRALSVALYQIAVAVWVGAMLAIGFIAAPVLFSQLADRSVAGSLAGAMFTLVSWLGLACGTYLIVFLISNQGRSAINSTAFWIVLSMLTLTIGGHFWVQPLMAQLQSDALPGRIMESVLRDRFTRWHRVSTGIYLLQSVLGIALVILQKPIRKA